MPKQIPILYNTEMVQAVQREINPKSQTRRTTGLEKINENPNDWILEHNLVSQELFFFHKNDEDLMHDIKCPFGKVGDLLYVRETVGIGRASGLFYYRANYNNDIIHGNAKTNFFDKWTPAIHMPKAACRIWLEITDIKVERLKDISEEDAIAEGVEPINGGYKNYVKLPKMLTFLKFWDTAKMSFLSLWESINGYESSELNPWVWVITFKKVAKP